MIECSLFNSVTFHGKGSINILKLRLYTNGFSADINILPIFTLQMVFVLKQWKFHDEID